MEQPPFILLLLLVTPCINMQTQVDIKGRDLAETLSSLTKDTLGAATMQEYLNNDVQFDSLEINPQEIIKEIAQELEKKFKEREEIVQNLRNAVTAAYNASPSERPLYCCTVTSSILLEKDPAFETEVNKREACYTRQPTPGYDKEEVLKAMIDNDRRYKRSPKWQYYGDNQGNMLLWPAKKQCNSPDPRFLPWYVGAATPVPKDLVIMIDTSGSMATTIYKNKTLLAIAKQAATAVLATLGPQDRVNIVKIGDGPAKTPSGLYGRGCYSNELAQATPKNYRYLQEFVKNMTAYGSTKMTEAIIQAFKLFKSTPEIDGERDRVILVLSDGNDYEDEEDILMSLSEEIGNLNKSVVMLTYGLGELPPSAKLLLENLANFTSYTDDHGYIKRGTFKHIEDLDNLQMQMVSYYQFFNDVAYEESRVTFSLPYQHAHAPGLLVSACLPVVLDGTRGRYLAGVTCSDFPIWEMIDDISKHLRGRLSYAFLIDKTGRTFVHPSLPVKDNPVDPLFVHITSLERHPRVQDEFLKRMMQGEEIDDFRIVAERVFATGDPALEGAYTRDLYSTYAARPIAGTEFCLGLVTVEGDVDLRVSLSEAKVNEISFHYHRLDIDADSLDTCKYYNRIATIEGSTVMLTPSAFTDRYDYLDREETRQDVLHYEAIIKQDEEIKYFPESVRDSVILTSVLNKYWINKEATMAIRRYIGTVDGVFRAYPGAAEEKHFDHTLRPWFKRSMNRESVIVVSRPYMNTFNPSYVVTISTTVSIDKYNNAGIPAVFGVMAMDVTIDYMWSLVTKEYPYCQSQYSCFLIDYSGFVVIHKDFLKAQHGNFMEKHVLDYIPYDGQIMKTEGCLDFEDLVENKYIRIEMTESYLRSGNQEFIKVPDTNLILVVSRTNTTTAKCSCKLVPQPGRCGSSTNCPCPCYSNITFQFCLDRYMPKQTNVYTPNKPTCPAKSPPIKTSNLLPAEAVQSLGLPSCYEVSCYKYSEKSECAAMRECGFCPGNNTKVNPAHCDVLSQKQCQDPAGAIAAKPKPSSADETQIIIILCVIGGVVLLTIIFLCSCSRNISRHGNRSINRNRQSAPATIEEIVPPVLPTSDTDSGLDIQLPPELEPPPVYESLYPNGIYSTITETRATDVNITIEHNNDDNDTNNILPPDTHAHGGNIDIVSSTCSSLTSIIPPSEYEEISTRA